MLWLIKVSSGKTFVIKWDYEYTVGIKVKTFFFNVPNELIKSKNMLDSAGLIPNVQEDSSADAGDHPWVLPSMLALH